MRPPPPTPPLRHQHPPKHIRFARRDLNGLYTELVRGGVVSDADFWRSRQDLVQKRAGGGGAKQQAVGLSSALLAQLKPASDGSGKQVGRKDPLPTAPLRIKAQLFCRICRAFPAVLEAGAPTKLPFCATAGDDDDHASLHPAGLRREAARARRLPGERAPEDGREGVLDALCQARDPAAGALSPVAATHVTNGWLEHGLLRAASWWATGDAFLPGFGAQRGGFLSRSAVASCRSGARPPPGGCTSRWIRCSTARSLMLRPSWTPTAWIRR